MGKTVEEIIRFGQMNGLSGVVNWPAPFAAGESPGVIMLNAGMLPRVGPFRMNVELARRLGGAGYLSLRFDLSGFGDSEQNRPELPFQERFIEDVRDAMNALQRDYGVDRFVIVGLCTGADNAHKTALSDDRVVGVVFLDGYFYPSVKFYAIKLKQFLRERQRMKTFFRRRWVSIIRVVTRSGSHLQPATNDTDDHGHELPLEGFQYQLPPKRQVQKELETLAQRQVVMLFVFSGGTGGGYLYRDQLFGSMPSLKAFSSIISIEFMQKADHTFSLQQDRDELLTRILGWLEKHFENRISIE